MSLEPLVLAVSYNGKSVTYSLYKRGVCKGMAVYESGKNPTISYGDQPIIFDKPIIDQKDFIVTLAQTWSDITKKPLLIDIVAIKISVPGSYFLQDSFIDQVFLDKINSIINIDNPGYQSFLDVYEPLKDNFENAKFMAISDSGFHMTKPDYTWNYPIDLEIADTTDIKRFGYDGLSLESVLDCIKESNYHGYQKVIVCNLDNYTNVTAILNGKSMDTSYGYTKLDGLISPSFSGAIDYSAYQAMNIATNKFNKTLNENNYGLYGISGVSADIDEILYAEANGNHRAGLAMSMYIYSIRQAIAKMSATLEGAEMLVFTGYIGLGYPKIRQRVVSGLGFLQFALNSQLNNKCIGPEIVKPIHPRTRTHPIIVVPTNELAVITSHSIKLAKN